jgi:hypothetical protein
MDVESEITKLQLANAILQAEFTKVSTDARAAMDAQSAIHKRMLQYEEHMQPVLGKLPAA